MKLITAYIRHQSFEPIREKLLELGLPSISVAEVKGTGRQPGVTETYRGSKVTNYLRPNVRIEIAADGPHVQQVIDTILELASTDQIGDGKIFVLPIESSVRIRTGENGPETLQAHLD